jgi:antitoxin CptB
VSEEADLRRLRWRCRRGMLELDVVLRSFLDGNYQDLAPAQRGAFEELLQQPDETLQGWLLGHLEVTDDRFQRIVRKIRQHTEYKDK